MDQSRVGSASRTQRRHRLFRGWLIFVSSIVAMAQPSYPWAESVGPRRLSDIAPPANYTRPVSDTNSFASWLRGLPLKQPGARVHLYDGRLKRNQNAQYEVIDIDVGQSNLQQCADAVIRLHAEFMFAHRDAQQICYDFTSGDPACWQQWYSGMRPQVNGSKVRWLSQALHDSSYKNFRRYLNIVFAYAGTASLAAQLPKVDVGEPMQIGDVFIKPGFPGHAVLVIDLVVDANGNRKMLLAQSYMPAQEVHILKNPNQVSPWYDSESDQPLVTPEWRFERTQRYRLPHVD